MYFSFALAGHRGTCLRPLHIFALLCFAEEQPRWHNQPTGFKSGLFGGHMFGSRNCTFSLCK